jgi:tetratricopeptide (TPR) repeat protein
MKIHMNFKRMAVAVISISLVILFPGCQNFLGLKSDSKLVVPKSLADLQGILDDAVQMNISRTPSFGESSGDDYFLPPANLAAFNEVIRNSYVWKRIEYRYANDWSDAYQPVYNSNLCLELLEAIPRDASNARQWDNIKASALFFRSYYFYLLTMQFGVAYDPASSDMDLGIVLRLGSDFNIPSVRSSVKSCLDRVVQDASEALNLLPDNPQALFRPSKAAAYAHLSRVYLYMGDYPNSLKYADECLKLKSALMDFNSDTDILGLDLAVPFKKFNKETIFYSEMNTGFGIHVPSVARIDTALYASYVVNDLRRRAYFKANGLYQQFKGSYSSSATALFSGLATDEVYFNRSECRAWQGDIAGAMSDLNQVLKSRWKNTVAYIPITALDRGMR